MVAEPVTERELPTTEAEAAPSPEPIESPPAEDELSEDVVTTFLKEQKILDEGTSGDGDSTDTDEAGPDLSKLTAAEAYALGQQRGKSETLNEAESKAAEYAAQQANSNIRARVEGARGNWGQQKLRAMEYAAQQGLDSSVIGQQFDEAYGHFKLVHDQDVQDALNVGQQQAIATIQNLAASTLGPKAGKALVEKWNALPADQKSTPKFFELYKTTATDGWISPSDKGKEFAKQWANYFNKLSPDKKKVVFDAIGFNPPSTKADTATRGGQGLTYKQVLKNPKLVDSLSPEEWDAIVAKG